MGAWGEGMQDNDTALDGIGLTEEYFKKGKKDLDKLFLYINKHFYYKEDSSQTVLGIVDWLIKNSDNLEKEFDIKSRIKNSKIIKLKVKLAIKNELKEIGNWVEPKERKSAIKDFQKYFNSI